MQLGYLVGSTVQLTLDDGRTVDGVVLDVDHRTIKGLGRTLPEGLHLEPIGPWEKGVARAHYKFEHITALHVTHQREDAAESPEDVPEQGVESPKASALAAPEQK